MEFFTVRLLGRPVIEREREPLNGLRSSKVQELLCYLLLNRRQPHTRESLAALLWSDAASNICRKYLRQTLWQLHLALIDGTSTKGNQLLRIEHDSVRVDSADLWLDVEVFEKAAVQVQGLSGEDLDEDCAKRLAEAVSLYRGDLLEDLYFDWCICERERFQCMYLIMLDKLMGCAEASGEYEKGLAYGEVILKHDRARELTYQRMMRLQCLAGDRAGALRQFQRCSISLDEELGVRPSRQTLEIYQMIRADRLPGPESKLKATNQGMLGESDAETKPATGLGHRLRRIRQLLNTVQGLLEEDIRTLDRTLRTDCVSSPETGNDSPKETK